MYTMCECAHKRVFVGVCVSASPAGLRLQCDMPVMFASLPHPEGVLVHQAAWVTGRGGCLAEGGLLVGGLKTHMHPHPVSWRKIQGMTAMVVAVGRKGGNRVEEVRGWWWC